MEHGSSSSTQEDGRGVDSAEDQLHGNLKQADVEAESSEVQGLSLQKPAVAVEVLLELGERGSIGVNDSLLIELKRAHDESHDNTEASTYPCDHAHFDGHHELVLLHGVL